MAIWLKENCKVTTGGKNLLARLQAGEQLEITRVVCSDNRVESHLLEQQSEIVNIKKELEFRKILKIVDNKATFTFILTNKDVTEPFYLNQIGIYAAEPNSDSEILYIIMQCENADEIPMESSVSIREVYELNTLFENEAGFIVIVSPMDAVTEGEFQQLQEDVTKLYNRSLVLETKIETAGVIVGDDDGKKYRWGKDEKGIYFEEIEDGEST